MKLEQLISIDDLQHASKRMLREVTVSTRIDEFLEDLNVDPIKDMPLYPNLGKNRRTGVCHASSIGSQKGKSLCGRYSMGCGREVFYSLTHAESEENWDPRIKRILDTGTVIHEQLQGYLAMIAKMSEGAMEFIPEADIDPEVNPVAMPLDLSGHADGIITIHNEFGTVRFGLEIKTISTKGYEATSSIHPEHKVQGTIYQACLDLPVMLFVYYNKNDSSIAELVQTYDPDIWAAVQDKISMVQEAALDGTPPPREGSSWACKGCSYHNICKPPTRRRTTPAAAAKAFRRK